MKSNAFESTVGETRTGSCQLDLCGLPVRENRPVVNRRSGGKLNETFVNLKLVFHKNIPQNLKLYWLNYNYFC